MASLLSLMIRFTKLQSARLRLLRCPRTNLHDFDIPTEMTKDTLSGLRHISFAFENCIVLCLHSIIGEFASQGATDTAFEEWREIAEMLPLSKNDALQVCVKEIQAVPTDNQVEAGLLPLLVVVASESRDAEQIRVAIQRVKHLSGSIGMGNQRKASYLLQSVWEDCLNEKGSLGGGFLNSAAWAGLILT